MCRWEWNMRSLFWAGKISLSGSNNDITELFSHIRAKAEAQAMILSIRTFSAGSKSKTIPSPQMIDEHGQTGIDIQPCGVQDFPARLIGERID